MPAVHKASNDVVFRGLNCDASGANEGVDRMAYENKILN